jgi:hypothetical protein
MVIFVLQGLISPDSIDWNLREPQPKLNSSHVIWASCGKGKVGPLFMTTGTVSSAPASLHLQYALTSSGEI